MSLKTLAIWIILAGLLGGVALLLRQQQVSAQQHREIEWVNFEIDPASITSVELTRGTAKASLVRSETVVDQWVGHWEDGNQIASWPVSATRIRGALRQLATTRLRLTEETLFDDSEDEISLISRTGTKTTLKIGSDRSGGRAPARLEQWDESGAVDRVVSGWIETKVVDSLTPAISSGWRDEQLLQRPLSTVRYVRLQAGEYLVELTRGTQGWQIDEPIEVHANQTSVESLIKSLLALKATQFVDDPAVDDRTAGLDAPLAFIELGDEQNRASLTVGTRADVGGDQLYARVSTGENKALITLPTESLSKLTAVADAYVSEHPAGYATTSVREVQVLGRDGQTRLTAQRDGADWDVDGRRADSLTKESIDRLLTLLLQRPADAVRLADQSVEIPNPIGSVALHDRLGEELGQYDVALEQSQAGMRLLVITPLNDGRRAIWSFLGDEAQATGTWLTLSAGRRVQSSN